jgi:hypothetical protein
MSHVTDSKHQFQCEMQGCSDKLYGPCHSCGNAFCQAHESDHNCDTGEAKRAARLLKEEVDAQALLDAEAGPTTPPVGVPASAWVWAKARSKLGALIRLCGDGVLSNEAKLGSLFI